MIELDNLGMRYGDRPLLSGVSLSIPEGSFHFLTGPSGSGKTTVLRLSAMELQPTDGRISVLGRDGRTLNRDDVADLRQRIGYVHQDSQFIDHLSLAENVALPLAVTGQSGQASKADLDDLLGWVGLAHLSDRQPPELSGGERQRAALARAVVLSPDLVLADEPTGNVDWDMSERILDLLVELNRLGKTILCATHDLSLIRAAKAKVQARVLRIVGGGIQAAGADL